MRTLKLPYLAKLPTELFFYIFLNLSDLTTLFSLIQTCKRCFNFYKDNSRQITLAILRRQYANAIRYDVGRIFWELEFTIRHDFVKREDAKAALLELGWPLFRRRQLEELLLPLVRGLAWTMCIDDRERDAVALLRTIWDSEQLFSPFNIPKLEELELRRPTLIPVGILLAELDGQGRAQILSCVERLKDHEQHIQEHAHTVEIRGNKITLQPQAEYIADIDTHNNIALLRVYNPPRLPFSNGNTAFVTTCNLRFGVSKALSTFKHTKGKRPAVLSRHRYYIIKIYRIARAIPLTRRHNSGGIREAKAMVEVAMRRPLSEMLLQRRWWLKALWMLCLIMRTRA